MHTRQGVAGPAQPKHNVAQQIDKLREAFAPTLSPLEKLCPPGLCEQFMFMGVVDDIYLYKHVDTRRYLNVDVLGLPHAYNSATSSYYPISIATAMEGLAASDLLEELFTPVERTAIMRLIAAKQVRS